MFYTINLDSSLLYIFLYTLYTMESGQVDLTVPEAQEVLRRNRQMITVPANNDLVYQDEVNNEVAVLPDFEAIDKVVENEKRIQDYTLYEIPYLIQKEVLDTLDELLQGKWRTVLQGYKRQFSLAILCALVYLAVLMWR